jgi:hypothetical protein
VAAALVLGAVLYFVLPERRGSQDALGGASPSVEASAVPSPSTFAATSSPPPSSPPPRSPEPLTVADAADNVQEVLDRRGAAGDIRADVVLDVHNQVNNLLADPDGSAQRIEGLRKQLRERFRAQSITSDALAELDRALVELGNALSRG